MKLAINNYDNDNDINNNNDNNDKNIHFTTATDNKNGDKTTILIL